MRRLKSALAALAASRPGSSTAAPRRRAAARGMTLVEIMVVVVIISMVTGVIGVTVFGQLEKAKRDVARTEVRNLNDALELYKLSMGHYPTTAEGLTALVAPKNGEKPFLTRLPKDPWQNDYVYISPGQHNVGGFDLMSYGPDGAPGTDDDIGNWEATAPSP